MKRIWKHVMAASMLTVWLTACSAPGGSAPASSPVDGGTKAGDTGKTQTAGSAAPAATSYDGPQSLKIGGIEYPYSKAEVEAFKKKYPNIKVEFNPSTNSFEDGSVQALLKSGAGPDVMVVSSGPGRVGQIANAGLISPIEDTVQKYHIEDRYQKWVIDQTRAQGKGKLYELVEGVDVFQVYYNKELFSKAGISVPTTWEELLAACEKLKNAKIAPFSVGYRGGIGGGWMLGNLLEAAAGKDRMTEVIYGSGKFDQKEIVLAGQMLKELVDKGYVNGKEALAIDQEQAGAAFLNGKGAMTIAAQGLISKARKSGTDTSKFESFLLPSRESGRPARPSAGLAHSWVVNAASKNKAAAEKWLDYVSSSDYMKIAAANGAVLVPVVKVSDDITLDSSIKDAITKMDNGAGYNPSVYLPAKAKDAWYGAVDLIVTGKGTPEAAMQAVETELAKTRSN